MRNTQLTQQNQLEYNQFDSARDPYGNTNINNGNQYNEDDKNNYNPYAKNDPVGYQDNYNADYNNAYNNYDQNGVSLPSNKLADLTADGDLYRKARSGFIMKVYFVLVLQLAITVGMCVLSSAVQSFFLFQIENWWIFWVTIPIMIVVQIAIFCCPAGRRFPTNMICLFLFTICEAYSVSYITAFVKNTSGTVTVVVAAGITLGIVVGLTLYAIFVTFTARDYMIMWGIVIVILFAMLTMGIISIFTWTSIGFTNLYCALVVILFGIYLVWDTKIIVGGQRLELSLDDYVVGALLLYIDIIQIFLYILMMMRR